MSAKALSKVHKQISKKRGSKLDSLHENSRDAKRLRRASARDDKLSRAASTMMKGRQSYSM
jgi:translation machinery-associated protein 16